MQKEIIGRGSGKSILEILLKAQVETPFFVTGKTFEKSELMLEIKKALPDTICFSAFTANPDYESIIQGVRLFKENHCDFIGAVGGGSAMDVAKCIKAFSGLDEGKCYLKQQISGNKTTFLVMPTTAGTGSEATPFSVIYYKGEKQSVEHECMLPDFVILDGDLLCSLPDYQRKSTMLDALCHSIESVWSVKSTEVSIEYAKESIIKILNYMDGYLMNMEQENQEMLCAANLAGKAISITRTTAAHAMCYKITSLYQIAHGHAVAICLPAVWRYMLKHMDQCRDRRGRDYLEQAFLKLSGIFHKNSSYETIEYLEDLIFSFLKMEIPKLHDPEDLLMLKNSVNQDRLKNNPVIINGMGIEEIYNNIFMKRKY